MSELARTAYNAWRSQKWGKALDPAKMAAWCPDFEKLDRETQAAWREAAMAVMIDLAK